MCSLLTDFLFSQVVQWIDRAGKALRKAKKSVRVQDADLEALRAQNAELRARAEAAEKKLQELQDKALARNEGEDFDNCGSSNRR